MRGILLVAILALSALSCGGSSDCAERLNGTWQGGPMTVTYDFDAGQAELLILGKRGTKTLEMQKCTADEAVILSGDNQILVRFEDADHITIGSAGKVTLRMTRMPARP